MAWKNPKGGHGHVATVAPEVDTKGRPKVFNIGLENDEMSVANAFGASKRSSDTFGYFVLIEDIPVQDGSGSMTSLDPKFNLVPTP